MKILAVILVAFSISACSVLTPVKVAYKVVKFPVDLVLD